MKLLQWNIWYKEDPHKIASVINQINPDIVCAQEFITSDKDKIDTAKQIAAETKLNLFSHAAETWSHRPGKNSQANAIFSKIPFFSTRYFFVKKPHHNPPDARFEGRIYLEASFRINEKILSVGTTHLSYAHGFTFNPERKKEADNLLEIVKTKKQQFILTGDLNATPDSYTIQGLLKYLHNPGPAFSEKTWTTKQFDYHGFSENKLNWRIDYVFCTRDINVRKVKIVETEVSDHLPILFEFEL